MQIHKEERESSRYLSKGRLCCPHWAPVKSLPYKTMARFGLADDSDEDEVIEVEKPQKHSLFTEKPSRKGKEKAREVSPPMETDELATPQHRQQKPSANALVEDADGEYHYAHESRPRERVSSSDEEDEEMEQDDPPAPWPSRVGVEPHKIHVMQASFFRVPEQEAAMKAAAQRATTGKSKSRLQADRLLNASARLARKHSRGSDTGEGGMLMDKTEVSNLFFLFVNATRC